ncbi:MAG: hypothetical protein WDZ72_01260 [Cyclobacteriaceae bacterium]
MNNIPKKNIYKVPEGYFEALPSRILMAKKKKDRRIYISGMVAAAIVVIGILVFVFQPEEEQENYYQSNVNEEVEFYIHTGIWGDEEILLLAENPNEILDQITLEEWEGMNYDAEELMNYEILY